LQIAVIDPFAAPPLASDRIVVRTGPESVAFLGGAQWSDRLTRLVQTRLIQTFENGHSLRAVGRPGDKMTPDASLQLEIRRFEMDVETGQAVVEISVKFVREGSGRVAAAQIFSGRSPGPAGDGPGAAAALDTALAQVLRQIVVWTVART
jgi:cholesterol transport system auxiliary component